MPERPQRATDEMGAQTGLHSDDAWRQIPERASKRQPLDLSTEFDLPVGTEPDQVENVLPDVDADRRLLGAAARLETAGVTVVLAGTVEQGCAIVHDRVLAGQQLTARAELDVARVVVGEVVAGEGAIGSLRLVEHGEGGL